MTKKIIAVTCALAVTAAITSTGVFAYQSTQENTNAKTPASISQTLATESTAIKTVGANFVDEDNDGVCDNFGTGAQGGNGNGNGGANFVDEDNDGVCDNFGTGAGAGQQNRGNANGRGNGNRR